MQKRSFLLKIKLWNTLLAFLREEWYCAQAQMGTWWYSPHLRRGRSLRYHAPGSHLAWHRIIWHCGFRVLYEYSGCFGGNWTFQLSWELLWSWIFDYHSFGDFRTHQLLASRLPPWSSAPWRPPEFQGDLSQSVSHRDLTIPGSSTVSMSSLSSKPSSLP